jgi:hypothetical protein
MSTNAQIAANQKNALLSTGATTTAGAERSSKNATKHGLTGQTLVVSPEERDSYEAHVQAYMDQHNPTTHYHCQLVQQLADGHWSVHQAFVLQTNTIALIDALNRQMSEAGDPAATAAALAPATRQLNTYSIYETRRRRAVKDIQAELVAFEQELAGEQSDGTNPETDLGFVYSGPGRTTTELAAEFIANYNRRQKLAKEAEEAEWQRLHNDRT